MFCDLLSALARSLTYCSVISIVSRGMMHCGTSFGQSIICNFDIEHVTTKLSLSESTT